MASKRRWAQALAAGAALAAGTALAATPAVAAPALDLFYQRALMVAAGGACRLFSADVTQALTASESQARSAALRSGAAPAELAELAARADAAGQSLDCRSPAVAGAAQQVRRAFDGYARLPKMDFPGEFAAWSAERAPQSAALAWRVYQRDRFGWDVMLFGEAAKGADRPLMAVASFADGAKPYGARLVMRDPSAAAQPFLDWRQADIAGRLPIDARLAPRAQARVFSAEAMSPAGDDLAPREMAGAWAFRFPAAAETALASLDPRESVAVEFLFPGEGGESVRTAYVEVGDFAAAHAFQALPQR